MASFSNIEYFNRFFDVVTFRNWGYFFPDLTPDLVETSEKEAISLIHQVGLVPTQLEMEERRIPCIHEDEDGQSTGVMTVSADASCHFGFSLVCSQSHESIRSRKRFQKARKSIPCWLKSPCSPKFQPTAATWFFDVRLSSQANLFLVFAWVCGMEVTKAVKHCGVSSGTAVDWFSMCREVCEIVISHDANNQIGGEGLVVEVDETFLNRRKYGRGRDLPGESITIFGMYCRETKEAVFLKVKDKSRAVLWAQMSKYIRPGSRIATDGAVMYRNVDQALGFAQHLVVVHNVEFVNSDDAEAHTNGVECRNRWVKRQVRCHRTDRQLAGYMAEYWYRSNYFKDQECNWRSPGQNCRRFLADVKRCYAGPGVESLGLLEIGVGEEELEALVDDGELQVGLELNIQDDE